jgi:hypothetical protein
MPASEIDDIFSAKTKQVVSTPLPSSTEKKEKKKKRKAKKLDAISVPDATARSVPAVDGQPTKKRPAPEIIVDPSASLPSAKRVKVGRSVPSEGRKSKAGNSVADKEDEVRFKDSRGSGPRGLSCPLP